MQSDNETHFANGVLIVLNVICRNQLAKFLPDDIPHYAGVTEKLL